MHCNFNYNAGAFRFGTGNFSVNFTLDRTDSGSKADTTSLEITDVGSVSDDVAGKTHTLISKDTNYNGDWTKAIDADVLNSND